MASMIGLKRRQAPVPGAPEDEGAQPETCTSSSAPAGDDGPAENVAAAVECGKPATVTVLGSCPCGHIGARASCEEHADPEARQMCAACAREGHWCAWRLGRVA